MEHGGRFGGDGAGASSSAHSVDGSSGSFPNHHHHRRRSDDYMYPYTGYPLGSQPFASQNDSSRESVGHRRNLCCIGPAVVTILGTLGLLFGFYAPVHIEAGSNYSRVFQANPLFVREIQVKNDAYLEGPVIYGFHSHPSLNGDREWSYTYKKYLDSQHHQEWALWLNKGSRMVIQYEVETPGSGIVVAVLKGEDRFNSWLEDPLDPRSSLYWRNVKGEGQIEILIDEDDDYYFAFGNTNRHRIQVELHLKATMKTHVTDGYDSRCSLRSRICKVEVPLFRSTFVLLTTEEGVDAWRITISYKTRWATYIIAYGALLLVALLVKKRWKKSDEKKDEKEASAAAPLMNEKENAAREDLTGNSHDNVPEPPQEKEAGEERLCAICLDAEKDCFFDPCGHCATCYACGLRIKDSGTCACPICRQRIASVRRLFVS